MKKIGLILCAVFFLTTAIFAQGTPGADDTTVTPTQPKSKKLNYLLIGAKMPILYFYAAENSSENFGVFAKLPVADKFGVEFSANSCDIPVEKYEVGDVEVEGFGVEEYGHMQLDLLWYFMSSFKYVQAKIGVDYYRFVRGEIYDSSTTASIDTGTGYSMLYQEKKNLFGVNLGINVDVPLYESFYITTSLGWRYVIATHDSLGSTGIVDLSLGLGYKI